MEITRQFWSVIGPMTMKKSRETEGLEANQSEEKKQSV